ncbi:hypothetical protein MTO96_009007 [Rhipicephalus appendiculatus]
MQRPSSRRCQFLATVLGFGGTRERAESRNGQPPGAAAGKRTTIGFNIFANFLPPKASTSTEPCTFHIDGDCWLVGTLRPWNKILSALCLELIELRPATLCLRSNCLYSDGDASVDALRNGAYLFRWLPKQHACVQSICVDENRGFISPLLELDKALRSSAHLRHLTLNGCYSTSYNERDLCDGMATLKTLETFEFIEQDIPCGNLARGIASLLRKNGRHLVKVRFGGNKLSQRSTAVILEALLECQVLSEFSFDDNPLNKGNIETLAVVVRSLRNLKKLTLDFSIFEDAPFGPHRKGPREQHVTRGTEFERLPDSGGTALRGPAYQHDVEAGGPEELHNELQRNEGIVALANALALNDTLEKLDLSGKRWSAQAAMVFCRSLKNNRTPRSVVLGPISSSRQQRMELSHELSQHECHDRIALPWKEADLTPLTMALQADAQSLQELDLRNLVGVCVSLSCSLFDALASNTTVRVLKLETRDYDCRQGDALRNALISNRSIKSLQLENCMYTTYESPIISDVCKALLVNETVVQLSLLVCEMGVRTSKLFARMLGQNRTLTSITLRCQLLQGKRGEIISRGLLQNNTVTSFVSPYLPRNRASLRIREVIGRNIGLLNLAVKFVMRTNLTKRSAKAFEAVRGASSLVSQLSEVTGKSEQEALAAIEAADRYIRSHYLYLTGIVEFSVECHPSTQTQVDALNDDCWEAIAQFLTVSDVRDE